MTLFVARRYKRRVFVYDCAAEILNRELARQVGAQTELHPDDLTRFQLQLPVLPRQTVRVLNTDAMRPAATVIPSGRKSAVSGVHS